MAVYLNRTLSMVTGNASPSHENTNGLDRSLGHIGYENSPLQIFVKAKKKINDIFGEIEEYVVETAHFMEGKLNVEFPEKLSNNFNSNCHLQNTMLTWESSIKPKRNNSKVTYTKWQLFDKY